MSITVDQLVQLFQKLRMPARRSVAGLIGELCVILGAESAAAAVAAWRKDADERYDFVIGNLRVDAKSSTEKRRAHAVSFEQANPPSGTLGLLASVFVTEAGGGVSLSTLVAMVEESLGLDQAMVAKLRTIVADSLGETLHQAMGWHFDLALARSSLQFFDTTKIPAVRPPLPPGVSGLRFSSSLEECTCENVRALRKRLEFGEAALLPISPR